MTILREQLQRIVFHAVAAALVGYLIALSLERMIPGFISPFIDLPDLGVGLAALTVLAVSFLAQGERRFSRAVSVISSAGIACLGLSFFWSRVNGNGWFGRAEFLLVASVALVYLWAYARSSNDESSM